MFFTIDKFQKRVEELSRKRYFIQDSIPSFKAIEGNLSPDEIYHEIPCQIEGKTFQMNDVFIGRDKYLWLETEVTLPSAKNGFIPVGLFNFGDTGGGFNSGFESLLYINGHPYQGVDTYHNEVLFSNLEGQCVRLTFLLWTGLEGGGMPRNFYHRMKQADIGYLHEQTDEFYHFALAITETLRLLSEECESYSQLAIALDRALLEIDWDEDSFYSSIEQAYPVLMEQLSSLEKHTDITVHVIGHTHIDVAWLWRLKHTREKAQRSFSTALHLMELDKDFVFLQTQPQLYKYIKQDCPELYKKICQKVADGQWEADGGMWVEADCNLSSGESLVRQFLHGTRFFEEEFHKKCEYLWLPDVFGYSWALPQILKLCEINTFMTTKISWNQYNTIPDDLFFWRGIDGSEILTYFINTPSEGQDASTRYSTYNGLMTPHAVLGSWKKFKNKRLCHDTLISYGYGDGGGGVTRDMLMQRHVMDLLPCLPKVIPDTAGNFFRKLHDITDHTDQYIHTWDGELYLEYHRGTYTSQASNKKANRYLENKLLETEWISSLDFIRYGHYDQKSIHDIWECVLLHQFHDIIPGSSIHEVYKDSKINYHTAQKAADHILKSALEDILMSQDNSYSIYSFNSFSGNELVLIPELREGVFLDRDGHTLPSQKVEKGYLVLVKTAPFSLQEVTFSAQSLQKIDCVFSFNENKIDTPHYQIQWDLSGNLTVLYDKDAQRSVLREGEKGNVLELYEDKPVNYDAWDIDLFYIQKMEVIKASAPAELLEVGNLRAIVRFTYHFRHSSITQDMIVYRDSRRIDFRTHVDWHEDHRLLKTAFHTNVRSTKATYEIQFGHVERPTHWNQSWDWARFEVCGHRWADLSETGYGISLLNDCKYGYSIKDHIMQLSLLKSAKYPDTEADMGEHDFTYSLYPHIGSITDGGTIEEASRLNLPARCVPGKPADCRQLIRISSNNVMIDAVKKAEDEDCLIVHLHECHGARKEVTLSSDYPIKNIVSCNLLEHDLGEGVTAGAIRFTLKPFEIRAFKLYL